MIIRDFKHLVKKLIGKSDNFWYLDRFEQAINSRSLEDHKKILDWAEKAVRESTATETAQAYSSSADPIVQQGWHLKQLCQNSFRNKYAERNEMRFLIHCPDPKISPAGFSLFQNMAEALAFLGLEVQLLRFGESTTQTLQKFRPTFLLTSDHSTYLEKIDWPAIANWRKNHDLKIGLTASIEAYGNTALAGRLHWAKSQEVDFYYTFRESAYIKARSDYQPFFDHGYQIFSIPFGANPLVHYPLPGINRDLDYVFIASTNKTKAPRYYRYMREIVANSYGFIDGPGWKHTTNFHFDRNRDRYIYARAKVGLNIHLDEQRYWANETNERTYQLAACGVPILTDQAKVLGEIFGGDSLFVAQSPRQYRQYFQFILTNPEAAQAKALKAQKEVFEKYTTFHRADNFVKMLSQL